MIINFYFRFCQGGLFQKYWSKKYDYRKENTFIYICTDKASDGSGTRKPKLDEVVVTCYLRVLLINDVTQCFRNGKIIVITNVCKITLKAKINVSLNFFITTTGLLKFFFCIFIKKLILASLANSPKLQNFADFRALCVTQIYDFIKLREKVLPKNICTLYIKRQILSYPVFISKFLGRHS